MLADPAAEGSTTAGLAGILQIQFFVILVNYLFSEYKNPNNSELKSVWVYESGELCMPKNNPAPRPPPEIAKLGGASGSMRQFRGWQPDPQRTLPLEGVLDTLAPQGSISGLSPPRMGRDRLARG